MIWLAACRVDQLREALPYPATLENDEEVSVVLQGGTIYALEDRCSHADVPLSQGQVLDGARIRCRAHGAEFDLGSGKALCAPAFAPVRTYPVKVEDGVVYVETED